MVNITLTVPDDLKKDMEEFKIINWSEVAREAFKEKLSDLKILREITKKSKLTEKDAVEISRKMKAGIAKKHGW